MYEKMYLHLLILCGILCQGIISTSDEDTRESSDFLVHKRRVIRRMPGGRILRPIEHANYIVTIRENGHAHCTGSILSRYNVITVASCFRLPLERYTAHSASDSVHHDIQSKAVTFGYPPHHQDSEGIALLIVNPTFEFSSTTGYLTLHIGPISPGAEVTVFGWRCTSLVQNPPVGIYRPQRSIILPNRDCENFYRNNYNSLHMQSDFAITEKHYCAYHPEQNCGISDAGSPLVVNNTLVAIHLWKRTFIGRREPDVYIRVNRPDYTSWIIGHSRSL